MEDDLTQERSIWGPMCADDDVVRWELDPTEGPCRMRKRMLPDPNFYRHYPVIRRSNRDGNEGTDVSSVTEVFTLIWGIGECSGGGVNRF